MRSLAAVALALGLLAAAAAQPGLAQPAPAPEPAAVPSTATPGAVPSPPPSPAATPVPTPAATPVPTPAPAPIPTAAPAPVPAPAPAPLPTPAPTPIPTAAASASPYHYVVTPPAPAPGQPVIREIDMLDQTLHAGGTYSVRVYTSPDVTTLNIEAMGGTYGMQAAGPGVFASDGKLPGFIPFFMLDRSYTITVIAQTADGRSTSVPLTLRLER